VGGFLGVYDSTTFERIAWHHRTTGDIEVVKYSPNGRQVRRELERKCVWLFVLFCNRKCLKIKIKMKKH